MVVFLRLVFILPLLLFTKLSYAYLNVKVTDANYNPVPIAIFNFAGDEKSTWISHILNQTLTSDLQNSGMFALYNANTPNGINYATDLTTTKKLLSDYMDYNAMIIGKVRYINGMYQLQFVVWDVYNAVPLVAKGFNLTNPTENDIYYTAHYIGNEIYKALIGEDGYFNSKIAFVSQRKVYIMDYDGRNKTAITSDSKDVYTPTFSSNNRYLAYITLVKGVSSIYVYDLNTRLSRKLGNFKGLVLAPRFSPDNRHMMFAISKNGSTNIFQLDLYTKTITELTYSYSINIPGSYSPDGKQIVFTSDRRNGIPQIYIMNSDGTGITRISSLKGRYYTPKWSPRGDLIAFTKIAPKGQFAIGVMDPEGDNEKILAEDNFAEGPAWTNNGRSLIYEFMYDLHNDLYAFYMINLAERAKILIKPFNNAEDPTISNNIINKKVVDNSYSLY